MPELLSRFELETGADFSSLNSKNQLRALRLWANAMHYSVGLAFELAADLKATGQEIAAQPNNTMNDVHASLKSLEDRMAQATGTYAEKVKAAAIDVCNALKDIGLETPRKSTKH